jgi:hypothetical protein
VLQKPILSVLLRIIGFILRLQQSAKIVIDVPPGTISLSYAHFNQNLSRCFTKGNSIEPNCRVKNLSDFSVRELVALLFRHSSWWSPKAFLATASSAWVFLDCSCANSQKGWIVHTRSILWQRLESVELLNHHLFIWRQLLVLTSSRFPETETS